MKSEFNHSYTGRREELLRWITGGNLAVLDVGCATGANGRWLLAQGIARRVDGIEIDPAMAHEAARDYSNLHVGSLEDAALLQGVPDNAFDWLILGDVIEHLSQPGRVLQALAAKLKPGGRAVISVPNMRHLDVFLHLFLQGDWPANERGIFDRTHLQVFTEKKLVRLLQTAGFRVDRVDYKHRVRDALGSRFQDYPVDRFLKFLFPRLYIFQIIALATRRAD